MVELDDHKGRKIGVGMASGSTSTLCRSLVLQSKFLIIGAQWKMGHLMTKAGERSRGRSPVGP